ncbi:hypothetical protein TNCV_2277741 [Trichonephila clavipes]|nr:hypothetical protein TNCV_2277741 [Trichonephila clavipes]
MLHEKTAVNHNVVDEALMCIAALHGGSYKVLIKLEAARNRGGKNRQAARNPAAARQESELNELRLEIESIRSNVKRTSCAEDRKKTSSNYRISIGRAEEHMRETSPAVLMAEATIPVTTPIKEENGMDDLRVVYVKVRVSKKW